MRETKLQYAAVRRGGARFDLHVHWEGISSRLVGGWVSDERVWSKLLFVVIAALN